VRVRDVVVGQAYRVWVPQRLRAGQFPAARVDFPRWWRLTVLQGAQFVLTVIDTAPDDWPRPVHAVEGLRTFTSSYTRVDLTDEQASALGLPFGAYAITGTFWTPDGAPVQMPEVERLVVPARWLHDLDEPLSMEHRNLDVHDF
jgi:hypothetical protein